MEAEQGLPLPQRYWAILVVALGITLAVLDGAIANVALPTIARTLNATPADSIWVVNAYQLTITISLLPLASLGDRIGYRRVYMAGLALFTLASFGCALSGSLVALTVTRVVQGFGAAGIMSVNTALVRMIYPPDQLGRGVSINATVVAISRSSGRPSLPACSPSRRGRGCSRSTCRSASPRSPSGRARCRARPGIGSPTTTPARS